MVLRKQADDIFGKVAHVFANHEANMASNDLLIVDHSITKLGSDPLGVLNVC